MNDRAVILHYLMSVKQLPVNHDWLVESLMFLKYLWYYFNLFDQILIFQVAVNIFEQI